MGGGDSLDKFMSRTGSSRGVTKQNGEIIAVPHPVMKKSYADNAAGGSEVATSTMRGSFTDPRRKAPLMKYHPNALRNRLPVEFKDAAIPAVRFCHPRNNHTYDIFSGNKEVRTPRHPVGGGGRHPQGARPNEACCSRHSRTRSLLTICSPTRRDAHRRATSASVRPRRTTTRTTRCRWANPTRASSPRWPRSSTRSRACRLVSLASSAGGWPSRALGRGCPNARLLGISLEDYAGGAAWICRSTETRDVCCGDVLCVSSTASGRRVSQARDGRSRQRQPLHRGCAESLV